MLPSQWLFQVFYQALSPLIDLEILWTLANVVRAFVLHARRHARSGGHPVKWLLYLRVLKRLQLIAVRLPEFRQERQ